MVENGQVGRERGVRGIEIVNGDACVDGTTHVYGRSDEIEMGGGHDGEHQLGEAGTPACKGLEVGDPEGGHGLAGDGGGVDKRECIQMRESRCEIEQDRRRDEPGQASDMEVQRAQVGQPTEFEEVRGLERGVAVQLMDVKGEMCEVETLKEDAKCETCAGEGPEPKGLESEREGDVGEGVGVHRHLFLRATHVLARTGLKLEMLERGEGLEELENAWGDLERPVGKTGDELRSWKEVEEAMEERDEAGEGVGSISALKDVRSQVDEEGEACHKRRH